MYINELLLKRNLAFLIPRHETPLMRIGSINDGGYLIPEDSLNQFDNLLTLGLGLNWDFEKNIFGINPLVKIYAYDKSVHVLRLFLRCFWNLILNKPQKRKFQEFILRFNLFLDYIKFWTLNSNHHHIVKYISENNLSKLFFESPLYFTNLKIDIEGDEYQLLPIIVKYHENLSLLIIEFHDVINKSEIIKDFIFDIGDHLHLVHTHLNNSRNRNADNYFSTVELTFSNLKLPLGAVSLPHRFDSANVPNYPDFD